jgi:hypothetical protein
MQPQSRELGTTYVGLLILATCIFYVILGEVNGRLPEQQQISMFVVNAKVLYIVRKHAEFYPDSNKRKQMIAIFILAFVLFFGAAW